jgi:hypothetical protein
MAVAVGQLHNLGTCPFELSTLEPSTREQLREEGQSKLGVGAIVVTCQYSTRCYSAVQSGNQVPISYRETKGPHSSCTKVRTRISY